MINFRKVELEDQKAYAHSSSPAFGNPGTEQLLNSAEAVSVPLQICTSGPDFMPLRRRWRTGCC